MRERERERERERVNGYIYGGYFYAIRREKRGGTKKRKLMSARIRV